MRTAINVIINITVFILGVPLAILFAISYIMAAISIYALASLKNRSFQTGLYILVRFIEKGETKVVPKVESTPMVEKILDDEDEISTMSQNAYIESMEEQK